MKYNHNQVCHFSEASGKNESIREFHCLPRTQHFTLKQDGNHADHCQACGFVLIKSLRLELILQWRKTLLQTTLQYKTSSEKLLISSFIFHIHIQVPHYYTVKFFKHQHTVKETGNKPPKKPQQTSFAKIKLTFFFFSCELTNIFKAYHFILLQWRGLPGLQNFGQKLYF